MMDSLDPFKVGLELFIACFIATVVLGCLKLAHVYTGWLWLDISLGMTLLLGGAIAFIVWLFIHCMAKM